MRAFREKKKQIQEEKAGVIAHIVKENFEKLKAEEDKRQIIIPVPQRFYCMEHKIYETPQDYNEEMTRRTLASDFRHDVAYKKGREDTAREILQDIMTKISSFEVAGLTIKSVDINIEFVKNLAKKYGIEFKETGSTIKE